ncbi:NUDIX domain-containing protein [Nocardioides anomalus]|uniref:NUDIX domain-containing protein n=1 Tax=Nocardioides anomalus TaxID=2712223 RepID=A0A6G6WC51_9ACTN|nr:NUDIX domain-containing protein [Nocardioides anomalus]QIG42804.1 NUDIX domain-containing protein [Nocardioides anomalus]
MSWTTCRLGHRHWGPRGAAGLLVADAGRALLQLRAGWAHQGGTWSVPGGARERGESGVETALREAGEEMAIRPAEVDVRASYVADCGGGWTYETVLGVPATAPLHVEHLSESVRHVWAEADEVDDLPLHPAFRAAWDAPDGELRAFVGATSPA